MLARRWQDRCLEVNGGDNKRSKNVKKAWSNVNFTQNGQCLSHLSSFLIYHVIENTDSGFPFFSLLVYIPNSISTLLIHLCFLFKSSEYLMKVSNAL
jgi:hypothetical protein